jgi:hypothetical protein
LHWSKQTLLEVRMHSQRATVPVVSNVWHFLAACPKSWVASKAGVQHSWRNKNCPMGDDYWNLRGGTSDRRTNVVCMAPQWTLSTITGTLQWRLLRTGLPPWRKFWRICCVPPTERLPDGTIIFLWAERDPKMAWQLFCRMWTASRKRVRVESHSSRY